MLWSVEGGRSAVLKKCIKDRDTRLMVVCLIMAMIMLVMIASLFVIAIYLDLHPRLPIVFITNTTVGSFSVIGDSSGRVQVQAFMDFAMQSNNRYGIPFRFLRDTLLLEYKGQKIGIAETPPFAQEPRSNRSFIATLDPPAAGSVFVVEAGDAARNLLFDFQVNRVGVTLSGSIKARFRASKSVTSYAYVPVSCSLIIQPVSLSAKHNCQ